MNRGDRKFHEKRVQDKRKKYYNHDNIRHDGKLKHGHLGCGCILCKPWKHGKESKLKPSERKKLIDQITEDNLNIDKDWVKF